MLGTTGFRTDPFFGLEDSWLVTGPGEVTHLHEVGSGAPVLLLHGSGTGVSAAANWWLTLPVLGEDLRALAIDLVGFGATVEAPDASYGIRAWGAHAIRVLDALGIDRAWLVGNSLGGWIALQLAIDHPDRVLGVVSMGTGGGTPTAAIRSHSVPDTTYEGLTRSFRGFVTDPSLVAPAMVRARQEMAAYDVSSGRLDRVIAARETDRTELPLTATTLRAVITPTLLVHGLDDQVIPASRTWELVNLVPRSDALLLHDCGHWSQIERPDAFTTAVREFVAGHLPTPESPSRTAAAPTLDGGCP